MTRFALTVAAFVLLSPLSLAAGDWRYSNPADATASSAVEPTAAEQTMVAAATVAAGEGRSVGHMPVNNMTMDAVTSIFGQPDSRAVAVGEPPITRWYYADYTVYFESDRVIISVAN